MMTFRTGLRAVFWAYLAVLTVATHLPRIDPAYLDYLKRLGSAEPDKSAHFIGYGLLGLLGGLAFPPGTGSSALRGRPRWMARLLAVLAAWAMIDEVTQPLFGRHAEVRDWFYDVAGLAIGIALAAALVAIAARGGTTPPDPGTT